MEGKMKKFTHFGRTIIESVYRETGQLEAVDGL